MKNSFILYHDYVEKFKTLSDAQFGKLIRCMLTYDATGEMIPIDDAFVEMAFNIVKMDLDKNREKYENIVKRNQANGKKGGRPRIDKSTLYTETGKIIPDGKVEGKHFLYLIRDITTGEYKIGETANLIQRRYDIKRPTNNLSIVDYVIDSAFECQRKEREILQEYRHKSTGGDWFIGDDEMAVEILEKYFSKKPSGKSGIPNYPKKPDKEKDKDKDKEKDKDIKEKVYPSDIPKRKFYPNDEKLDEAFANFAEMRKKIRRPLSDHAIELAMKKLQELSGGDNELAIKILDQSTFHSWQGLFELKQSNNNQTTIDSHQAFLDKWRNA